MLKKVATKVAGRNIIVSAAIVFMEMLSRLVSSAIEILFRESLPEIELEICSLSALLRQVPTSDTYHLQLDL